MRSFFYFFISSIFFLPALVAGNPLNLPKVVEFGNVEMGEKVQRSVLAHNTSDKTITIARVKSSCGCTVAKLKSKTITPGGNTTLSFSVDTQQKLGKFNKSVRVYIEGHSTPLIMFVKGMVSAPKSMDHSKIKNKSVFHADCAKCHVEPGKKAYGLRLYHVDCAYCHGTNRQGGVGPALGKVQPHWKAIIFNGTGPSMPGFSKSAGGPRSEQQIESLLTFLNQDHSSHPKRSASSLYYENCSACHGTRQMGGLAPSLKEALPNYDKDQLLKLLMEGTDHLMMPSFLQEKGGRLKEEEIKKIVDYLKPR